MTPDGSGLSFQDFLAHCRTFDPAWEEPRSMPDWPYLWTFARALEREKRLLVLKSRQMMATWIGCAYLLHRALHGGPGHHLVLSKEERSARDLIERVVFLHDHLPEAMRGEGVKTSRERFSVTGRDSHILSLPASPHAVRGRSPKTVFWDEIAFCQYDEEMWTAIKPAIDSGGRFIGVSTPNGPSGVFARLAHDTSGAMTLLRMHYSDRPDRGKGWQQEARAGLSVARWRREHELSFEGAEGKVYDQFSREVHVIDRDKGAHPAPVRYYRGVDFGYRKPAVVWAREDTEGNLMVFDALVGDRWTVETLLGRIRQVDRRHGLNERDFTWTAVDPAGAAHNDYGLAPAETLKNAGIKCLWRTSSLAPGIEAVRSLLVDANGQVRLRVHRRCDPLILAFEGYTWGEDGETPRKDGEHDHPLDALRYLVINLPRFQRLSRKPVPRVAGVSPQ